MSGEIDNVALAQRGEMLLQMRRPREAEKLLRQGIGRDIDWSEGYRLLGRALLMQGRLQEAAECAEAALAKEPHSISALTLLAIARFHQLQIDAAEHHILEILRINPEYSWAIAYRCKILRTRKKYAEAEHLIRQGLGGEPENAELLAEEALLFLDKKQYENCLRTVRNALRLHPDDARFHFYLGKSEANIADAKEGLEKHRHYKIARDHILSALRLDPTDETYRQELSTFDMSDRCGRALTLLFFINILSIAVISFWLRYEFRPTWIFMPIWWACGVIQLVIGIIVSFTSPVTYNSLPMGFLNVPNHPMPWKRRLRGWCQFAVLTMVLLSLPAMIVLGTLKLIGMYF